MTTNNGILICEIEVSLSFYAELRESIHNTDSAEEVVLVVPRHGQTILLHTKSFYPPGTYRLPSERMLPGENPDDAFTREFREELGMEGHIACRLGIIRHHLKANDDVLDFTSYVYLALETTSTPQPQDSGELITGFIEVPIDELTMVAEKLRQLPGRWRDWGRFRAVAHDFAAERLKLIQCSG